MNDFSGIMLLIALYVLIKGVIGFSLDPYSGMDDL
jgi:hypothetical protein